MQDPDTGQQMDEDLWVIRKGAIPAAPGQMGLIPGSMGACRPPSTYNLIFLDA